MNYKKGLALLGSAALLGLGMGAANAAVSIVSVTQNSQMGYNFTPTQVVTFNNFAPGTEANFTTQGITFSDAGSKGGAFVQQGNGPGTYSAPVGDSTPYLALGSAASKQNNKETITLANAVERAGIYWGSIDSFNTIVFKLNGNTVGTFSGLDVANFSSTDGIKFTTSPIYTYASAYVNFTGKFDQIVLRTTQPNFEVDNIAIGGVPEASTWAMMLIGFAGLGTLLYRRSRETAMPLVAA